ncbi:MAG: hypothetical protein CVU12_02665 [Bacteroidetes bacterium HGW-Bacteroidetes-7]|jgi:hypothetical protein|nr:MAG: hypothetical protein CVU12_02665 [Bacteroidetes bacterium HGW-Bacteroidetes-7]
MEKLNYEQHLFFSLFSVLFFGKRLRTVQRPKGGVPEAPKNTKKKALKKTALRIMSFPLQKWRLRIPQTGAEIKKGTSFEIPLNQRQIFELP